MLQSSEVFGLPPPHLLFATVLSSPFLVSLHVTLRVREPVPHALLHPDQVPDTHLVAHAAELHAFVFAGSLGSPAQFASPTSVFLVPDTLWHAWPVRLCVPPPQLLLHVPYVGLAFHSYDVHTAPVVQDAVVAGLPPPQLAFAAVVVVPFSTHFTVRA